MNPIKLPSMNNKEIEETISQQFLCRIAFLGKEGIHMAPFQYVFLNGQLYFHFTDYGNKIVLLKEGNEVCVEIERNTPDLGKYSFVTINGTLKIVEDKDERRNAIEKMADFGENNLSTNFLHAHGFESKDGWTKLKAKQDILVVKLDKIRFKKGLKSP